MYNFDEAKVQLKTELRALEGERLKPYLCQAGIPTIGVGSTAYADGRPVKLTDPAVTAEESEALLDHEATAFLKRVAALVPDASTRQLVGMACLAFNIGVSAFANSTVLRLHNQNDFAGAKKAFLMWIKITDPVSKQKVDSAGLIKRREHEAEIYL